MRQDQRWNNAQYYRPRKIRQTKTGKMRWTGEKTAMIRVVRGTRYYADAVRSKQQLELAGTTDANIRGYSITIPGEQTQTGRPLKCRYYAVYARKVRQIGPRIQRF